MKPSSFLRSLGRPVAYYPALAKLTGGIASTVFLCQLLYWQDKGSDAEGWIYKSQKDWEAETGLSEYEQRHARKMLGLLRILDEREAGIPCRLWYRINIERLDELWEHGLTNLLPIPSATSSPSHPEQEAHEVDNKKPIPSAAYASLNLSS